MNWRTIGRRLARVLLWLVAVLLGAELLLRLLVPEDFTVPLFDRSHHIYKPENAREHPYSVQATNLLRIAIIGDSVAMGAGVQRDERFGSELERFLNLNAGLTPVEVNVYAKPTSTYQQSAMFARALDWGAAVIIAVLSLNDTEDWSGDPALKDLRERARAWNPPSWLRACMRHSFLVRLSVQKFIRVQVVRHSRQLYEHLYDPNYSGWLKLTGALHEYAALCRERDVRLVAMLFPLMNQEFAPGRYPFDDQHAALRRACEAEQIPFLDVLDWFRDSSPIRLTNIPDVDDHPNEIGHRIAAEQMMRFLVEERVINRKYRPRRIADERMKALWKRHLQAMGRLDDDDDERRPEDGSAR
ncbi:MAG: SGNH/GDSL hydrolase family protein [Kiritimatiellae bacterium]|nr:SGNH/GDSL hydrolase family protein [Kiritimatiellia bacterium]